MLKLSLLRYTPIVVFVTTVLLAISSTQIPIGRLSICNLFRQEDARTTMLIGMVAFLFGCMVMLTLYKNDLRTNKVYGVSILSLILFVFLALVPYTSQTVSEDIHIFAARVLFLIMAGSTVYRFFLKKGIADLIIALGTILSLIVLILSLRDVGVLKLFILGELGIVIFFLISVIRSTNDIFSIR